MKLTVVGCGDAFGSGGRLNTCFHVQSRAGTFLIDCGASALIGLRRLGLDPGEIDTIFITHLHGDHFGGLPWVLIDAQHVTKRSRPLTIVGPTGTESRFTAAAETLFPRSTQIPRAFDLTFVEYDGDGRSQHVGGVMVTPFEVRHACGAPPYALRFEVAGKILTFSGDTGWVDSLYAAGADADLFICECYQYDVQTKYHLDFKTISRNLYRIGAKRTLLTHMSEAMLARTGEVAEDGFLLAEDGMVLEV